VAALESLSDQELLALLKEGDRIAFGEIYKRYWSVMYMHALKMLRQKEDARDAVQELFTSLWRKGPQLTHDTNLAGYLYITVKNKVLDQIAQKKVRAGHLESLAHFLEEHRDSTTEAITQKELMSALDREIEQLPPKMKAIFNMRIKGHLSYKAIAEELNISDKTVKKQVSNAIAILKPKLGGLSGWAILAYLAASQ
jgi:RNA polymerase sigma-70 factor (family 1)